MQILNCIDLVKHYDKQLILNSVNLSVYSAESVSIVGKSGSGKSTLLYMLAGLDDCSSGSIHIANKDLSCLNDNQLCKLRNQYCGFIYQFHHLLRDCNVLDNTLLPLMIANNYDKEYALYILEHLGLIDKYRSYPASLSGGERQRVAVARALINRPKIIFADEPTGNLDTDNANIVIDILFSLQEKFATSVIIVTHDLSFAKKAQRQYSIFNKTICEI